MPEAPLDNADVADASSTHSIRGAHPAVLVATDSTPFAQSTNHLRDRPFHVTGGRGKLHRSVAQRNTTTVRDGGLAK